MTIAQPNGAVPIFLFLGQSYFGRNSYNGRIRRRPNRTLRACSLAPISFSGQGPSRCMSLLMD